MKRVIAVLGLVMCALGATPIYAQPPASMPSGMMPMEMCRQMMMGGSMMSMTAGAHAQPMDPKMMGQMMEMHGEMMKAMGDIMMKHAKKMQGMTR